MFNSHILSYNEFPTIHDIHSGHDGITIDAHAGECVAAAVIASVVFQVVNSIGCLLIIQKQCLGIGSIRHEVGSKLLDGGFLSSCHELAVITNAPLPVCAHRSVVVSYELVMRRSIGSPDNVFV